MRGAIRKTERINDGPMTDRFTTHLSHQLSDLRSKGLFKPERVIQTPQGAHVDVPSHPDVLNLCANNYLGLAQHPAVNAAAQEALKKWGYGLASVRFICGTQQLH